MPTSRPFAYNTGSTLSNTAQYGNIAVLTGTTLPSGVQWWNGPDEDIGYVITSQNTSGNQPNPLGIPAYIQFNRTTSLNSTQFISLASLITGQNFTGATQAQNYLLNNGYWTSYTQLIFNQIDGYTSSYGITSSGVAYSWGDNSFGQLGNNSDLPVKVPTNVCGNLTFCSISSGIDFAVGLTESGQAYSWGLNSRGQLGINSIVNQSTPVAVCGGYTFCKISVGYDFVLAVTTNGIGYAWGANFSGCLGDNSTISRSTPVAICGGLTFSDVNAGGGTSGRFSLGLTTSGLAYSWGHNSFGQLGDNTIISKSTPVAVCGGHTFTMISASGWSGIGLNTNGIAYSWGGNNGGVLGNNSTIERSTPVAVCGGLSFSAISAGDSHVLAASTNGTLYAWGTNTNAQLGIGTTGARSTPTAVCGGINFKQIAAGFDYSLGISNDNISYGWGQNQEGQLGINYNYYYTTPTSLSTSLTFGTIIKNNYEPTTFGLTTNNLAYSWGRDTSGLLGANSFLTSVVTPIAVCGGFTWCQISAARHAIGITTTGIAYAWGSNLEGQLGTNSTIEQETPVAVCGGLTFCQVAAGNGYSLGILASTFVMYSWGSANNGCLGDNSIVNKSTPVAVCGGLSFCNVSAGDNTSYGVTRSGLGYSWGGSNFGALGDNSTIAKSTPIAICGGLTFVNITAGSNFAMGITAPNPKLYGWGYNVYGQLGINTTTSRLTPVEIGASIDGWNTVSAGSEHVLALTGLGEVYAWGRNNYGQIGDGTFTNRSTPTLIMSSGFSIKKVYAGVNSSFAVDINNNVYAWGRNFSGQLGFSDGVLNIICTPVIVSTN